RSDFRCEPLSFPIQHLHEMVVIMREPRGVGLPAVVPFLEERLIGHQLANKWTLMVKRHRIPLTLSHQTFEEPLVTQVLLLVSKGRSSRPMQDQFTPSRNHHPDCTEKDRYTHDT